MGRWWGWRDTQQRLIDKVYQLIKVNQAQFPTFMLCETLGVSRSGYYDWVSRIPSQRAIANAKLTEQIIAIHRMSDFTYGRPRITAELADLGIMANHKRVGRLMRLAKIKFRSGQLNFVSRKVLTHHSVDQLLPRKATIYWRSFLV